jgi:hypothetical protein
LAAKSQGDSMKLRIGWQANQDAAIHDAVICKLTDDDNPTAQPMLLVAFEKPRKEVTRALRQIADQIDQMMRITTTLDSSDG